MGPELAILNVTKSICYYLCIQTICHTNASMIHIADFAYNVLESFIFCWVSVLLSNFCLYSIADNAERRQEMCKQNKGCDMQYNNIVFKRIELGRCNYTPWNLSVSYKISVAFWLVWLWKMIWKIDNFPFFVCETFFVKGMASWQVFLLLLQRIFHTTTCEFCLYQILCVVRRGAV